MPSSPLPNPPLQPPDAGGRAPSNAILAQQQVTLFQALQATGWVQGYDYVVFTLIALVWVTLLFWKIFASPTLTDVLGCCLVNVVLMQAWTVSLMYRCMHFVLMVRADVNMLPTAAAKIVIAGMSGGQKGGR